MVDLPPPDGVTRLTSSKLTKTILWSLASVLAVFILGLGYLYLTEPTAAPQNIKISNVTDTSVSVSWETKTPVWGFVLVDENPLKLAVPFVSRLFSRVYADAHGLQSSIHYTTLTGLNPETSYYFKISTGLRNYSPGFHFTTGNLLENQVFPNPAYGEVWFEVGDNEYDAVYPAVVYLETEDSALASTLTNETGGWAIDLSSIRMRDYSAPLQLSEGQPFTFTVVSELGTIKKTWFVGEMQPAEPIIY